MSKLEFIDDKILIKNFTSKDGLKGSGFYPRSACIDSKNRIWWGTGKGVEMIDLNRFSASDAPPTMHLNWLEISGEYIDYRSISDSLSNEIKFDSIQSFSNYPLNLEIPYSKNHLTFYFSAIDWAAPHKIQYSYIMDGLKDGWSVASEESNADYRNIPYGDYTFRVKGKEKGKGESGDWGEAFAYKFSMLPSWWHAWW
ncbi:MAG: hypothetical protein HRT71_12000 [Flavobacteriales bacterium]|nr:hypothetical protein [Flavobacteriales bacterium]